MKDHIQYLKLLFSADASGRGFQERLSDLFPAIIYVYDFPLQRLTYVNRKITDILGYQVEDVKNMPSPWELLVWEEDRENFNQAIHKLHDLKDSDSLGYTARFNHSDGSWRHLKLRGAVLTRSLSGSATSALLVAEDITEQTKKQHELAATKELFDETERLLQFGSWSWNAKTGKTEWTSGMFELLEYDRDEVSEDLNQFYIDHIVKEHLDGVQRSVLKSMNEKKGNDYEYIVTTKGGSKKLVSTKTRVITDNTGALVRILGITRDVTAVRNYEKERERIIRELNRSNKELEEFAYIASHDLQEPLRKILTFSERLKNRYAEPLGDDGNLYLDRIVVSAGNMRNLIGNLLEFSKITRSSRAYVQCDLSSVISEVLSDQDLRIEETGTTISVSSMPIIEAVPSEMRQLFNNLIGNAVKFRKKTEPPAIKITCEKVSYESKTLHNLKVNRDYFQFSIIDNGIGFESEYAEKIFEIFQRLHGKAEYAGSGIGLAICKRIADNHEGTIFASSVPGKGSTFSVILPEKQFV
jgi:PAS domain S-box-containing protein